MKTRFVAVIFAIVVAGALTTPSSANAPLSCGSENYIALPGADAKKECERPLRRANQSYSPATIKRAGKCDYCVCNGGTVKPVCKDCC
jgi:hypothetical protein